MSIEMTQEFLYETDDLKLFETVLRTILPIIYGKNHHPRMCRKAPFWDDGKDYHRNFSVVPTPEKWCVITPCQTYHGSTFHQIVSEFSSREEAAADACQREKEPKPTRQWITSLELSYGELDSKHYIGTRGTGDAATKVMEKVKETDGQKFLHDFSHVEREEFNWFDGTIRYGWRMEHSGMDSLDISMVHILYGK